MITVKQLTDGLYNNVEEIENCVDSEQYTLLNNMNYLEIMKKITNDEEILKPINESIKKSKKIIRKLDNYLSICNNYNIEEN